MKNTSRLPVKYVISYYAYNISRCLLLLCSFSWHIPGDEAEPLRVQPSRGTLLPNEHQCHVWSFIPAEVKKYGIRCGLTLGNGCDLTASPKRVGLLAIGEGTVGEIEVLVSTLLSRSCSSLLPSSRLCLITRRSPLVRSFLFCTFASMPHLSFRQVVRSLFVSCLPVYLFLDPLHLAK